MSKKKKDKGIIGVYKATEKKFGFVEVDNENQDIFIPSNFVNNAIDGDIVRVKIYKPKEKDKKAEGKIDKILQRNLKENKKKKKIMIRLLLKLQNILKKEEMQKEK